MPAHTMRSELPAPRLSLAGATRVPARCRLRCKGAGSQQRAAGTRCRAGFREMFDNVMKGGKKQEDINFAPLDRESEGGLGGTSEDVFGPLAVLLVGFSDEDYSRFQNVMQEMEADMVPVFCADEATLQQSLQTALAKATPGYNPAPEGTKRGVFLSGMYTAEVLDVVGAYRDEGLPEAVFAAAVPMNYSKKVQALLDEVLADDDAARQRRPVA